MKKILFALAMVLAITPLALAENSEDSSYTDDESLVVELTAEVDSETNAVSLEWSESTDEDFQYYKVMRSQTDADITYPEHSALYVGSDSSMTTYADEKHTEGTHYYRVCVITSDMRRGCSETVTLELEASTDADEKAEDKTYTDDESIEVTLDASVNADGKGEFSWDEYTGDDFLYYKLVKSNSTDSPVYPDDPTLAVFDSSAKTSFTGPIPAGMYYYSLCVVTDDYRRGCSNSVQLEGETRAHDKDKSFEDIRGHWAEKYILKLRAKAIIDGDKENFRPNDPINRAEAIKMIVLAAGLEADTCDPEVFPDLRADDWFCKVATIAHAKGFVEGDNGLLNPSANLNRAQAVKLVLAAKAISVEGDFSADFPDVDKADWFARYAYKAKKLGYIQGKKVDGKFYFDPAAPITRAELAKIIRVAFY